MLLPVWKLICFFIPSFPISFMLFSTSESAWIKWWILHFMKARCNHCTNIWFTYFSKRHTYKSQTNNSYGILIFFCTTRFHPQHKNFHTVGVKIHTKQKLEHNKTKDKKKEKWEKMTSCALKRNCIASHGATYVRQMCHMHVNFFVYNFYNASRFAKN